MASTITSVTREEYTQKPPPLRPTMALLAIVWPGWKLIAEVEGAASAVEAHG